MTSRLTIAVCYSRPLFTAFDERDARTLIEFGRAAGHDVEALTLPTSSAEGTFSEHDALCWALIDLIEVGQRAVDVVVCMDPATMLLRHPNKVAWIRNHWSRSITDSLALAGRVVLAEGFTTDAIEADDGSSSLMVVRVRSVAEVLGVVCASAEPLRATR